MSPGDRRSERAQDRESGRRISREGFGRHWRLASGSFTGLRFHMIGCRSPVQARPLYRAVARRSDVMNGVAQRWREFTERRFDGFASLEVHRSCGHPMSNQSDKTFGTPHKGGT